MAVVPFHLISPSGSDSLRSRLKF